MFNQDRKQEFIDWDQATYAYNYRENIFKNSAKAEEYYHKDLCDFNRYEIEDLYKVYINSPNIQSIRQIHSLLRKYATWCWNQHLITDGINHFDEVQTDILVQFINQKANALRIFSREMIEEICGQCNPRESYVILACFEYGGGKSRKMADITRARPEWVDGDVIHLPGRDAKISKLLQSYIQKTLADDTYITIDGKEYPFIETGYIYRCNSHIRDISLQAIERSVHYNLRLIKQQKDLGDYFTVKDITSSGMLYMVQKRADELGISNSEYLENYKNEVMKQYGKDVNAIARFKLQYKGYF